MSKITFINDKNYLALVLPFKCKILSSAVLNGGLSEVKSLLNLKVDKHTSSPILAPDVTLNDKSMELKLPSPITGMMTAALTEALIMLTESKVTVLRDNEVLSPISGLPASGTGTDSHAVFCPKDDNQIEYCGKHTLLGELIGKAVTKACSISIWKCLSL